MAADLPDDVDARADELFCLAPGEFVTARDALVKELRADGRREEAGVVAKLAKPSVPAWAVNQVVRTQRTDVRALWAAGDAVVAAQAAMLAGDAGRDELRTAVEGERAALAPLAQAARGLMTAPGKFLGEPPAQEVIETLHAAALDPDARGRVEAGRLSRPLRMAGMGAVTGGGTRAPRREAEAPAAPPEAASAPEPQEETPAPPPPPVPKPDAAERARRTEARAVAARAAKEADAARRRLARAERDHAAAEERVERARARLRDAEDTLEAAEDDVDARRAELTRAEDAAEEARVDED